MQFAENIFSLEVNNESPEKTVLDAINLQENYYKSIGMPTSLRELSIKENDLEELAMRCSFGKTRILDGYKKLGYDDILTIYKMAY